MLSFTVWLCLLLAGMFTLSGILIGFGLRGIYDLWVK